MIKSMSGSVTGHKNFATRPVNREPPEKSIVRRSDSDNNRLGGCGAPKANRRMQGELSPSITESKRKREAVKDKDEG
jgi:hypothetical protein